MPRHDPNPTRDIKANNFLQDLQTRHEHNTNLAG
jgi:hypothetical protein